MKPSGSEMAVAGPVLPVADLSEVAGKTHKGACTCKEPEKCKCKKSSFGPQSLSTKHNFPRTVFGSSLRDNSAKVVVWQPNETVA